MSQSNDDDDGQSNGRHQKRARLRHQQTDHLHHHQCSARSPAYSIYQGFRLQNSSYAVDRVRVEDPMMTAPDTFNEQYVRLRKPCVLLLPPSSSSLTSTLPLSALRRVVGDVNVEVERRLHANEAFGQNRTVARQVHMTVAELLDTISITGNNDAGQYYYLSTQSGDEVYPSPVHELVQAELLPRTLPWAKAMQLQSCNLWLGTSSGSSSGLHYDYHDNFYLVLHGRKRFELWSPDSAPFLELYGGDNVTVQEEGNSSSNDESIQRAMPIGPHSEVVGREQAVDDSGDDEEESIVLGKGFDYRSDTDDNRSATSWEAHSATHDDFDECVQNDDGHGNNAGPSVETKDHIDARRPDNFSRIDLTQPRHEVEAQYPAFARQPSCVVELRAGECLYLPARWLHHVTSVGNEAAVDPNDSADEPKRRHCCYHLAVNYWYEPPEGARAPFMIGSSAHHYSTRMESMPTDKTVR